MTDQEKFLQLIHDFGVNCEITDSLYRNEKYITISKTKENGELLNSKVTGNSDFYIDFCFDDNGNFLEIHIGA